MNYKNEYEKWLNSEIVDEETKKELRAIAGNEKEIEERFYRNLEFGTGGLRGVMESGTNRMNKYIVRKATQGLSNFIHEQNLADKGVVISYDSRNNSELFARETACVFAANGIKVHLSDALRPVPMLSFGVRHFEAAVGVMVTASHNPAKYNGYKVYGEDGGQAALFLASKVLEQIESIDIFDDVKTADFNEMVNNGMITLFGDEFDEAFLSEVLKQRINPDLIEKVADDFKLIYTPLHGSGNMPVRKMLKKCGYKNILLVEEQLIPDGNFPTVQSPNPENKEAFTLAIELAKKNDVDFIVGTDPDCDRCGIVVRNLEGEYIALTGNMVGALLTEYILSQRKKNGNLPADGVVVKTIVTTRMADVIAKSFGVEVMNTLTGFKFIGEKIHEFEEKGDHTYLFGFEESYGYLSGTYARDKDGVLATMLICEMAAYYRLQGKSLYEALLDLYATFGTFREGLKSITLEGMDGVEKIKGIMADIRANLPATLGGKKILYTNDIKTSTRTSADGKTEKIDLPVSDVLLFEMEDDCWCAARPSGTEPKMKFYFGVKADSVEEAERILKEMDNDVSKYL